MPVLTLDRRTISGVVQHAGDALSHYFIFGPLTESTLSPSAQAYSSRVSCVVITVQSSITRILIGIPSVNPSLTGCRVKRGGSSAWLWSEVNGNN